MKFDMYKWLGGDMDNKPNNFDYRYFVLVWDGRPKCYREYIQYYMLANGSWRFYNITQDVHEWILGELYSKYIILREFPESIDFHCSDIVERIYNITKINRSKIKICIWNFMSSLNYRTTKVTKDQELKELWDSAIEPVMGFVRGCIIKKTK